MTKAIGKNPKLATIAVIKIGRNLEVQVKNKLRVVLKVLIKIIEFRRLIPIRAINPI